MFQIIIHQIFLLRSVRLVEKRHMTDYSPGKTGSIWVMVPSFENYACYKIGQ